MFILMLGTNVEANTNNITLSEFKSLVKADGYNMDNVTFPSYFNQLLNNNPIIFYNQDRTKIMCFTGIISTNRYGTSPSSTTLTIGIANNQYTIGYSYSSETTYPTRTFSDSFKGYNISGGGSSTADYRIGCSINLTDYSFSDLASGYNGNQYYYGKVYPYIGYDYSYYQKDYTLDNFKSLAFIKSKLLKNMIFYGKSLYYSDNDVFYIFNGTIKYYPRMISGDVVKWKTNAIVTADDANLAFNYSPNYDVSHGRLNFVVDLEELTPSEVIKQDDYYGYLGSYTRLFSSDINNFNYSDLTNYNIKYNVLIKQMKDGYIYRLRFYVEETNDNMNSLYYDISTSCYFSLNDWKSSTYIIKNIYKLCFSGNTGLEEIPGNITSDEDKIKLSDILSFNSGDVLSEINGIKDIKFDFANTVLDYQTKFFNGGGSGDLEISWNGISLFGAPLIKSGTFNISKLVREDEQLTRLHHIIQVFSISSFGIYLISAYWNLFLATLGLGSYFYMNSDTEIEALEDNTAISEMDSAMDEYRISQAKSKRDNYYSNLVAKSRANLLRKAGRKDE